MIDREAIYAALWSTVSGNLSAVTKSRRLRHWSDVSGPQQPAIFQSEKMQVAKVSTLGAPTLWTLSADIYVYVYSADDTVAPATLLNPMIDAVDSALAPTLGPGGRMIQNLGLPQYVQHAYITGRIETDEGVLGNQAVAIIPVEILCVA